MIAVLRHTHTSSSTGHTSRCHTVRMLFHSLHVGDGRHGISRTERVDVVRVQQLLVQGLPRQPEHRKKSHDRTLQKVSLPRNIELMPYPAGRINRGYGLKKMICAVGQLFRATAASACFSRWLPSSRVLYLLCTSSNRELVTHPPLHIHYLAVSLSATSKAAHPPAGRSRQLLRGSCTRYDKQSSYSDSLTTFSRADQGHVYRCPLRNFDTHRLVQVQHAMLSPCVMPHTS